MIVRVENDWGPNIVLDGETHQPVMQWRLTNSGPMDGPVRIQVGTVTGGGWYARHMAFGAWRFPGRQPAWNAVRALMSRHKGKWERAALDSGPFEVVCRPDGSRVIYDMNNEDCLHACWGEEKERLWDAFSTAIDGGGDYRVVDYPRRPPAEAAYEDSVYANQDDEVPFKSCDMPEIAIDRKSTPPPYLTVLPSGTVLDSGDREEYDKLWGLPLRSEWPRTGRPLVAPGAVCAMTAEPRDWGPAGVDVRDGHSGQVVRTLSMPEDVGWDRFGDVALAVLPDLRVIVAATNARATLVWDVESGTELTRLDHTGGRAQAVDLAVRPDGRVLLATGKQGDHPARVLRMDVGR